MVWSYDGRIFKIFIGECVGIIDVEIKTKKDEFMQ